MSNARTTRVRPRRARRLAATTAAAATAALSLVGPGVSPARAVTAGAPSYVSFNPGTNILNPCPHLAKDFQMYPAELGFPMNSPPQQVRVCYSGNQGNIQIDQVQFQWMQYGCYNNDAGCLPAYDVNELSVYISYDSGPNSSTKYDFALPEHFHNEGGQNHWRQYDFNAINRPGPTGVHAVVRVSSCAYLFEFPGEDPSVTGHDPAKYNRVGEQFWRDFDIRLK